MFVWVFFFSGDVRKENRENCFWKQGEYEIFNQWNSCFWTHRCNWDSQQKTNIALKNDGWNILLFLLTWSLFTGHVIFSGGGGVAYSPTFMVTLLSNYPPWHSKFTPEKMVGSETRLLSVCVKRFSFKGRLAVLFLSLYAPCMEYVPTFTINLSHSCS